MKVLEKGRKQKGWATETRCTGHGNGGGGCGAKLLVDTSDMYRTYSGANYGGDTPEPVASFKCVECGVQTDLQSIPRDVLDALPEAKNWRRSRAPRNQDPLD